MRARSFNQRKVGALEGPIPAANDSNRLRHFSITKGRSSQTEGSTECKAEAHVMMCGAEIGGLGRCGVEERLGMMSLRRRSSMLNLTSSLEASSSERSSIFWRNSRGRVRKPAGRAGTWVCDGGMGGLTWR